MLSEQMTQAMIKQAQNLASIVQALLHNLSLREKVFLSPNTSWLQQT